MRAPDKAWLEGLKVGDEVAVQACLILRFYVVGTVVRETKTLWDVNSRLGHHWMIRKESGRIVGSVKRFIEPVTDIVRDRVRTDELASWVRYKAVQELDRLLPEQVEQVRALVAQMRGKA
ncbi:MAG: hypothetical protein AB9M53_00670 [Leptothrix sp. (in: b-proteobacteria)]